MRQLQALGAKQLGATEAELEVRAGMVGRRGESGGVDFRTLARLAEPRTEFRPYWEPPRQVEPTDYLVPLSGTARRRPLPG